MLWFENTFLGELSWFFGMLVMLIAYLQKNDVTVKKLMVLSVFFWGAHYFLMGLFTGFVITMIWFLRLWLSVKYKKNKYALIFVISLSLTSSYFTYNGIMSLLPVIASMTGAYAYFYLEKIKLRLMMTFNSSMWLIYNFVVGSFSGMINEALVQVVLIVTIYRMIHPQNGMAYYSEKIANILRNRVPQPDFDRFLFIRDRVSHYRKNLWIFFLQILHYDLINFIPKKKKFSWKMLSVK